jgi:arylsulfatase A-like enzyme
MQFLSKSLFATLTVLMFTGTGRLAAVEQKPNVIVIVSDDAGYADFSMHGAKNFPTPRIDSIAANGVRFTSSYVSAPVCSPSRAGLMTGRYQQRFGHHDNPPPHSEGNIGLPVSEKTFADAMKAAGYHTIAVGKWHLGAGSRFHPLSRGFDEFYGFLGGARSYFKGGGDKGAVGRLLNGRSPAPENFRYLTDELGRKSAEYIRQNKSRPFFLYLAFNAVHTPYETLGEDTNKVKGMKKGRRKLCAMTIALDRAVGVVLDELKKQGLTDNTLVFFVNDNGAPKAQSGNNDPLHGFKATTWEGGIRVPFVVQWPGRIPKGKVYHQPVIALDIMPTAMAAAGNTDAPGNPLDGVNLLPYLTGENTAAPHEVLFWHIDNYRAVRKGDWKLTDNGGDVHLYNLAKDIGEKHDLKKQEPAKLKELEAEFAKWKAGNLPQKWNYPNRR